MSNEDNPLWLVNELHNHSEHRAMVGWGILVVDGESVIVSLNDPRTDGDVIRDGQGRRISIIQYLEESYTNIEKLQKTVRDKISQYAV